MQGNTFKYVAGRLIVELRVLAARFQTRSQAIQGLGWLHYRTLARIACRELR
jgi:hypothetical protein